MGALKKEVRADVRRAARILIDKYFREERKAALSKKQLNALVKAAGKEIAGDIVQEIRVSGKKNIA